MSRGRVKGFLQIGFNEVRSRPDFVAGVREEVQDYGESEHCVNRGVASRWDVQGRELGAEEDWMGAGDICLGYCLVKSS